MPPPSFWDTAHNRRNHQVSLEVAEAKPTCQLPEIAALCKTPMNCGSNILPSFGSFQTHPVWNYVFSLRTDMAGQTGNSLYQPNIGYFQIQRPWAIQIKRESVSYDVNHPNPFKHD